MALFRDFPLGNLASLLSRLTGGISGGSPFGGRVWSCGREMRNPPERTLKAKKRRAIRIRLLS
jgi:hypothetical protein